MLMGLEPILLLVSLRLDDDQHADIDHMATSIVLHETIKHRTDLES